MANVGDTVRLYSEFKDWDENNVNVSNLEVKIYDKEETLLETISTGIVNYETGKYYVPYEIPDENGGYIIYEFSGTINSEKVSRRSKIPVEFVGD